MDMTFATSYSNIANQRILVGLSSSFIIIRKDCINQRKLQFVKIHVILYI
jgi:hypothetical protein